VDSSAIAGSLEKIPYTLKMGIVIDQATNGEVQMTLPDAPDNQNMVGIVHAGALYTFGETVAGIAAGFETLDRAFPLARSAEIRYLRPARGAIRGAASVPSSESDRVVSELDRDGRSELRVAVVLQDEKGETVAEMDVNYSFRSAFGSASTSSSTSTSTSTPSSPSDSPSDSPPNPREKQ
jgi:acyl-coenzyme A thioesterase PaaI-like protein